MAAYFWVNLEITDPAGFDEYRKGVAATVTAYGGRFIVRGGAPEVVEGDWKPKRVVILEFPDVARIKAWYASPEYQPLLKLRRATSKGDAVILEGL